MAAPPAKKKLIESLKKGMYFACCNLCDIDFSISHGGRDDCRLVSLTVSQCALTLTVTLTVTLTDE